MNIRELVREHPEHRRVGIHFEDRLHVVQHAKKLYLELGIPCDIYETSISIPIPRIAAAWYAGLFERATGHIAFNEWEERP